MLIALVSTRSWKEGLRKREISGNVMRKGNVVKRGFIINLIFKINILKIFKNFSEIIFFLIKMELLKFSKYF